MFEIFKRNHTSHETNENSSNFNFDSQNHRNISYDAGLEESLEEDSVTVLKMEIDTGNVGFMVLASCMQWIMVPGFGFFYSGMARSKSAMSMIVLSLWSMVIISIQWFLIGYSLTFSTSSNHFVGNLNKAFLVGVYEKQFKTAKGIPELAFCIYQGVTATLPAAIIMGAVAERGRILPALIFMFIWNTLVYNPCGYWSLNPDGWSYKLGVLDFGGAAPVHVPAGAAALAYSYILGPRDTCDRDNKPHNMVNIFIGTVFIWFGSLGYNDGSAFGSNMQGLMSFFVTNLTGSVGALTWAVLDYIYESKLSAFGLCAGGMVGIIGVCSASGIVSPAAAIPFGIITSVVCRWGHSVKANWKFDDSLDVFAMHGLSGIVGMILTGVFAQKSYGGLIAEKGGWIDGHWMQVPIQCVDVITGFSWSFLISFAVLNGMNKIPALRLRMDVAAGGYFQDEMQMEINCYEHVQDLRRDSIPSSSTTIEADKKFAVGHFPSFH